MTQAIMKVLQSDGTPELVGKEYTVEITNTSIENLKNLFGDIKAQIIVARIRYASLLRSGTVLIGNIEYKITNSIHIEDATSWYLTEYRQHGS